MSSQLGDKVAAIVVAAGSGVRLGREIPKAAIEIAGVPMVVRAVHAMFSGGVDRVVVAAPEAWVDRFSGFLSSFEGRAQVIAGGVLRQDSVRYALAHVGDASVVLVHDAARPLVPPFIVSRVIETIQSGVEAVVPVVPQVDSLRRMRKGTTVSVDRSAYVRVQTPQGFTADVLRKAHEMAGMTEYGDDATMVEASGVSVSIVPGDGLAFKITEPMDLVLAEVVARFE